MHDFRMNVTTGLAMAACLILAINPSDSLSFPAHLPRDAAVTVAAIRPLAYADVADHVTGASIVVKFQPRRMKFVKADPQSPPPPGMIRVLMEGQTLNVIRGDGGVAPALSFLADLPLRPGGKKPKMAKAPMILFARPTGRPDFVQLVSTNAAMTWSEPLETRIRAVVAETNQPDAPPHILSVGEAFHFPGTVEGEGETQIFLRTTTGAPVSLSVVRRPGLPARWGVSLGEVVEESAHVPARDTLLWYRLACGLPAQLRAENVRTLPIRDAEAARADYAFIREALGTCERTL